jgi:hypothetical protein
VRDLLEPAGKEITRADCSTPRAHSSLEALLAREPHPRSSISHVPTKHHWNERNALLTMSYRWPSHHLMASSALTCQLADFTSQRSIVKVFGNDVCSPLGFKSFSSAKKRQKTPQYSTVHPRSDLRIKFSFF